MREHAHTARAACATAGRASRDFINTKVGKWTAGSAIAGAGTLMIVLQFVQPYTDAAARKAGLDVRNTEALESIATNTPSASIPTWFKDRANRDHDELQELKGRVKALEDRR